MGHNTFSANTTGAGNSAFGIQTLYKNTTANYNTAMGFNALTENTTGTENVSIGGFALDANVTGDFNTAVGTSALGLATGDSNTAVGRKAGLAVSSGINNVLVGEFAGSGVTTGGGNICIGRASGSSGGDLTTGGSNIVIGINASTSAGDRNNAIVMGEAVSSVANGNFTFGTGTTDSNIANGATSITAPSDQRYKEDILDATAGLSFIKDLRPVTFKWKKEKDVPSDHPSYVEGSDTRVMNDYTNHGFIAQEVKTAIDAHSDIKDGFDMWSEQGSGGRQRLGPTSLIPMLVKAIQEQNALIEALTARIVTLEG